MTGWPVALGPIRLSKLRMIRVPLWEVRGIEISTLDLHFDALSWFEPPSFAVKNIKVGQELTVNELQSGDLQSNCSRLSHSVIMIPRVAAQLGSNTRRAGMILPSGACTMKADAPQWCFWFVAPDATTARAPRVQPACCPTPARRRQSRWQTHLPRHPTSSRRDVDAMWVCFGLDANREQKRCKLLRLCLSIPSSSSLTSNRSQKVSWGIVELMARASTTTRATTHRNASGLASSHLAGR